MRRKWVMWATAVMRVSVKRPSCYWRPNNVAAGCTIYLFGGKWLTLLNFLRFCAYVNDADTVQQHRAYLLD